MQSEKALDTLEEMCRDWMIRGFRMPKGPTAGHHGMFPLCQTLPPTLRVIVIPACRKLHSDHLYGVVHSSERVTEVDERAAKRSKGFDYSGFELVTSGNSVRTRSHPTLGSANYWDPSCPTLSV